MARHSAAKLLLICLSLFFIQHSAFGQTSNTDLKSFRMEAKPLPGDGLSRLSQLRDGKIRTTGPDLNSNKQLFQQAAQYFVNRCTYEQYYIVPEIGDLRPRSGDQLFDNVINELTTTLLFPDSETTYTPDQADYIREYGIALNQAIRAVLSKMPPPPIRVNATRLLAVCSKTGSPAFTETIVQLLTDQFPFGKDKATRTPPEVLAHALRSAEALLSSYDPVAHYLQGQDRYRHSLTDKDLVQLVDVLEQMVLKGPNIGDYVASVAAEQTLVGSVEQQTPPNIAPKSPAGPQPTLDNQPMSTDHLVVFRYYRRLAVRALSRVRQDLIGGGNIKELRPGFTLAKIAAGDVSISPPPTTDEISEAVIGLCGLMPSPELNYPELLAHINVGLQKVVQGRNSSDPVVNRSVPWKLYAARLTQALNIMKKAAQISPRIRPHAATINSLAAVINNDVIQRLEKYDPNDTAMERPSVDGLITWMVNRSEGPALQSLYTGSNQFKVNQRAPGN